MFDKLLRYLLPACLLWGTSYASAALPPLSFGVFPNLSARQVVEIYRPLAEALEKSLHREVIIYSARDFRTFAQRTSKGEYDLLLTAPHLAWLARQDAGYRPLLKYATPTHGLLVVHRDSPLLTPEALRGKTMARADALAVTVLATQTELATRGLRAGIDYQLRDAGTHNNAVMQVINKRADAAALGMHPYRLLAPDLRAQLRVLLETPPVSSLVTLTHPRLRDSEAAAIRRALLAFAASPEGQAFMERGGYGGYAPVDGQELRAFRPYALEVQARLRSAP